MSWEDSIPEQRRCPCGSDYYDVIYRSDDWGRSDERWNMRCPTCKENYGLYAQEYNHKGINATYRGWVLRTVLRDLASAKANCERAKRQLTGYAIRQFGARWHNHFSGQTKKAVWRELTENGKSYPSLPTFYAHIKESSLEQVLAGYFEYDGLPKIIRLLKLSGSDLEARFRKIERSEKELTKKDSQVRQKAFTQTVSWRSPPISAHIPDHPKHRMEIVLTPYRDPGEGHDWHDQTSHIIRHMERKLREWPGGRVDYKLAKTNHGRSVDWPTMTVTILSIGGTLFFSIPAAHKKIRESLEEWERIGKHLERLISWIAGDAGVASYPVEILFIDAVECALEKSAASELEYLALSEIPVPAEVTGGFSHLRHYLFSFRSDNELILVALDNQRRVLWTRLSEL